ncbi:hypothetical protein KEJ49_05720 [Candidatus Bathyarchaeota archaeon]|nr:hypothetical protein [Candidatus Bathyarchaeota archaeon]
MIELSQTLILIRNNIRAIPVEEDGKILGCISQLDVIRAMGVVEELRNLREGIDEETCRLPGCKREDLSSPRDNARKRLQPYTHSRVWETCRRRDSREHSPQLHNPDL